MFQHPAPIHTSGHTSQAGALRTVACTICIDFILSCLPQIDCWSLLWAPEPPICPWWSPTSEGVSPDMGTSPSAAPQGHRSHFTSSFLLPFLSFVLPSDTWIFLVQGPLLVFSRSLWRLFHLSMHPWYYCERRWTPCPPILLYWLSSPCSFDKCTVSFIHHHVILHNSCTALKFSCPSLLGPLPTSYQIVATTVLFTVSLVLSFPEWEIIGI